MAFSLARRLKQARVSEPRDSSRTDRGLEGAQKKVDLRQALNKVYLRQALKKGLSEAGHGFNRAVKAAEAKRLQPLREALESEAELISDSEARPHGTKSNGVLVGGVEPTSGIEPLTY